MEIPDDMVGHPWQSHQPGLLTSFSSGLISKRVLPVFKSPLFMRSHSGGKSDYQTLHGSLGQAWLGMEGLRSCVPDNLDSGPILGPQMDISPPKEAFCNSVCCQSGHTCLQHQKITQVTSKEHGRKELSQQSAFVTSTDILCREKIQTRDLQTLPWGLGPAHRPL